MEEKFKFHPEAKKEFKDSVRWHETNRSDSGKEFASSSFDKINEIVNKPKARSADENGVRWASIKDFPYKIFYYIQSPFIWVLAIWHNSRKPKGWQDRIDDVTK